MFDNKLPKRSKDYYCVVSAHIYLDDKGNKDIEILTFFDTDDEHTDIFCDIDNMLLEDINPDFKESESYFFIGFVRAWFESSHSYYEGWEVDVECEIKELNSLLDLMEASKKVLLEV